MRHRIAQHGLRNSLLIAIAPTATIASIAGCYECIEPQVSNLFKRETLSGDFLQINRYLVDHDKLFKVDEGSTAPLDSSTEKASRTAVSCDTSERSYWSSTLGGTSVAASSVLVPSLRRCQRSSEARPSASAVAASTEACEGWVNR